MHTFTYLTSEDDGIELKVSNVELYDMALLVLERRIIEDGLAEVIEGFSGAFYQDWEIEIALGNNSKLINAMKDDDMVIHRCEQEAIEEYKAGLI